MQKSEFIHLSWVREKPAQKRSSCHTGPWRVGDSGGRTLNWDPENCGKESAHVLKKVEGQSDVE